MPSIRLRVSSQKVCDTFTTVKSNRDDVLLYDFCGRWTKMQHSFDYQLTEIRSDTFINVHDIFKNSGKEIHTTFNTKSPQTFWLFCSCLCRTLASGLAKHIRVKSWSQSKLWPSAITFEPLMKAALAVLSSWSELPKHKLRRGLKHCAGILGALPTSPGRGTRPLTFANKRTRMKVEFAEIESIKQFFIVKFRRAKRQKCGSEAASPPLPWFLPHTWKTKVKEEGLQPFTAW